ncbi:tRNA(Met) cytidine acetyltransferase TmcA [Natrarchaeobius oligotrophus]|uniref:tRNA(Met) cytidine acetyltransferase TmcA n=1 Tax=Natrarchaeobius chitinivorans TaxID=1679083 RepID=A0A3N6PHH1_NATCH|nr:tRNA(Met) cytidine acetyltransferase TmcA [Natrarchaeobius chitinivorans]RQH00060.1 tRNA(Met) cytidine acetyltransferase [Natrarchaeobius chitinivorans]
MHVGTTVATALTEEASRNNERRLLVLAGDRELGYDALERILDHLPVAITDTTLVGPDDRLRCEHLEQARAGTLLGTTREVVALDAHAGLRPNALGKAVGAVDGGGLLVLLVPSLADWPARRGAFDESLAVPPFELADVTGRFRRRLVETLRAHRGVAIVDLDGGRIEADGLTRPAPTRSDVREEIGIPPDARFPPDAYEACRTADQADAVSALESLLPASDGGGDAGGAGGEHSKRAVVLEADRGRGKSSAAGLAAGALAADGADVLVTAPGWRNAREVFERARALCETLEATTTVDERRIETATGGRVRFAEPAAAAAELEAADVAIVDEAAALPVARLESFLAADRIAFATTIHGYEGAGRGFSVRFRDRLAESDHAVEERTLVDPIRYAAGDPVEVWAFRALLLDARPPVAPLVDDADPETVDYRRLEPDALLADEPLLRETFGLLVLAHYRTEPNDLARLLDAPNLEVRALIHDGHVVGVALLAREGNLPRATRAEMYEGGRVRGNMLPDVLTSQLRDESAGEPAGLRVVRIAIHPAVRSRGLGSHLLERVREEFAGARSNGGGSGAESDGIDAAPDGAEAVDWLGTGFGATPELLEFWRESGYRTIHVSTTRNDASGEHSALMLEPTSAAGEAIHDRHAEWFVRRFPALCTDSLADLEPDVVREVLRSVDEDAAPPLEVTDHEWRVVAGAAYGPGLYDVDPGPFRALVVRYFLTNPERVELSDREERLLVLRVLQGRDWSSVADRLEYPSARQCMRALGAAVRPLVDRYGTEAALEVRDRFDGTN